jgi:hypothetical protein
MIPMDLKIQQVDISPLQGSDELLKAHQVLIDTWFDTWTRNQQERVHNLLLRKCAEMSPTSVEAYGPIRQAVA